MTEFELRPSKDLFWLDVWYEGEEKPRYMINMMTKACTCTGYSLIKKCKHRDEYIKRLQAASMKFAEEMGSLGLE